MKKKCLSLFVLLSFLVLQVLSPISGTGMTVSAADGEEGIANLKYSFRSIVYGQNIFTTADDGQNTVLIFGAADDEDTQRTVKSIAESSWVSRSDIRVIFAEISGKSASGMFPFKASYGSNYMKYCVNTDGVIYQAMCDYYHLFSDSDEVALPVTVLIDGKTDKIRHCLTGYQTADAIMDKMKDFVAAEPPAEPSQEPTETPAAPSQQPVPSEGPGNLYYTFESVDGTYVSTKSNPGQATVLVFGFTTCGWTQKMMKSIAESGWVGRSDIRVVFAEIDGSSLAEVQTFAASYGCDDITFCYDEGYTIYYAAEKYYQQFYNGSESLGYPFTVLIDGENQVRDCIMGYETADAIMGTMKEFVAAEPTATPGKEENPSKNSTVQDASGNTYQVTKSGKSNGTVAYVKAENNQAATVKVPSKVSIGGVTYNVTSVSAKAFRGNTKLKKVVIGKNVTSLGNSAFEGCTALKSIVIPSKVRSIGKNAFKNCKSLKSIRIKGNALKTVGKNAFKGIHAKAKIKVPKKQLKTYKKRLKGKGQKKTVKIIS